MAKLHRVLGITGTSSYDSSKTAEDMVDADMDMSKLGGSTAEPETAKVEAKTVAVSDDDDSADLEFFKNLAVD